MGMDEGEAQAPVPALASSVGSTGVESGGSGTELGPGLGLEFE